MISPIRTVVMNGPWRRPLAYLSLPLLWTLGRLPGPVGVRAESWWYWARRHLRANAARRAFEGALSQLGPGSVCIDLGANEGTITSLMAARAGHVHAFEPDPWAFARLRERLAGQSNVTLHNAAIGAKDGSVALLRDPLVAEQPWRSQGTSTFRSQLWGEGTPEQVDVPQVGIVGFLRRLGTEVSIVKMDVEGAEVETLEALLDAPERAQVRKVFVETHEMQFPELRPRLRALRRRIRSTEHPAINLDWE